jgi:hypothetical protein
VKHWKHIAILIGVGLLAVVINTKTKGKIANLISQIPVVGPMLS